MALTTSSGINIQYPSDGATAPSPSNTNHLMWTPAHEARLAHVQAQLSAAQAKWSEEQDLWLDEVGPSNGSNSAILYPEPIVHPHRSLSLPEAR